MPQQQNLKKRFLHQNFMDGTSEKKAHRIDLICN